MEGSRSSRMERTHEELDLHAKVSLSSTADTKGGEPATDLATDDIALVLKLLSERTSINYRARIYFGRFEKRWLIISCCLFSCSVTAEILARFGPAHWRAATGFVAILSLLATQACVIFLQLASIFRSGNSLFPTTSSFLRQEGEYVQKDFDLCQQISDLGPTAVRFVAMRLRRQSEHMRIRVSVVTGALDKVGMIPLLVSTALTVWKFNAEFHAAKSFPMVLLYLLVGVIAVVYVGGVVSIRVSHRLEELADLTAFAAEKRKE